MLQTNEPRNVNMINFGRFIFPIPAGIDINSRTPCAILPRNTAASPFLSNHVSGFSIEDSLILRRFPNLTAAGLPAFNEMKYIIIPPAVEPNAPTAAIPIAWPIQALCCMQYIQQVEK